MQEGIVQKLNLLLEIPFLNGQLLKDVVLPVGTTNVPHKLNRDYTGFFVLTRSSAATIFIASSPIDKSVFIPLTVSGVLTADLWVF